MLRVNIYTLKNRQCTQIANNGICFYSTEQTNINRKNNNNNIPLFDQIDLQKININKKENNTNNTTNSNNNINNTNNSGDKPFNFFLNYKPGQKKPQQSQSQPPPPPPPQPPKPFFNLTTPQPQQKPQNGPFPFNLFKLPNQPNKENQVNQTSTPPPPPPPQAEKTNPTTMAASNTTTTNPTTNTTTPSNPFLDYLKATTNKPINNNNNNNTNNNQTDPLGFAKFNFASPQPTTQQNKFEIPKIPIQNIKLPPPTININQNTEATETLPPPNIPKFEIPLFKPVEQETQPEQKTKEKNYKIKERKEETEEEKELRIKRHRHLKMVENFDPIFRVYKPVKNQFGEEQKLYVREIVLPDIVTVENLAPLIGQSMKELIKWQIKAQLKPTSRYEPIEDDILQLMAQDYLFEASRYQDRDVELKSAMNELKQKSDPSWPSRPPIVTVVGHIDHGKTSLLDYLRKSNVVDKEAGRITQHIGAFEVKCSDRNITFMDTPGHAAFSTMRERGVNMTDIALLIVAGDDGVQEQTIEAIRAIKKSGAQMVVAINKMDKPGIDANLIRYELAEHGVNCEGIGGEVPCVEISAKTGLGIDKLKETIILLSDIMELRAPIKDVQPSGVVVESTFKKNRGTYSTILIQKGILKQGDWFICGEAYGKIKEMRNPVGVLIKEGKPGQPVEIFGFKEGSPNPNDELFVFKTQKEVDELIEIRKEKRIRNETKIEMNKMAYGVEEPEDTEDTEESQNNGEKQKKEIQFFVKGDVTGSAEALITMLTTLPKDPEIFSKIKKVGHGEVTDTDIKDAAFMQTPIIYFGNKLNQKTLDVSKRSNVHIIQSDVIYHVFENVKEYLESQLDPVNVYTVTGEAKISKVFNINNDKDSVAGSVVESGILKKGSRIKISRDGQLVHDGRVELIKHFKEIVKEVTKGQECGITIRDFNDIRENDKILAYTITQEKRKLGSEIKERFIYNK